MTKAIIGIKALIDDAMTHELCPEIRTRLRNARYTLSSKKYGTYRQTLGYREESKISTYSKVVIQKGNQFIMMNTLFECLMKYFKDQSPVIDRIGKYYETMHEGIRYLPWSKSSFRNKILHNAKEYPNVYRNREDELCLIYDIDRIFPVFFNRYYSIDEAKVILSDEKNIIVDFGYQTDTSFVQQMTQFFREETTSTSLLKPEESSIECINEMKRSEPIQESKHKLEKLCLTKTVNENTTNLNDLSKSLKPIIIDLVHQYLDEAIDKLADTIAEEVSDCANEVIRFRNEKIKESVSKLLSDLDK